MGPSHRRPDSAYWLGDIHGEPLGPESDRTIAPCAQALTMIEAGTDPVTLVVWARLADGRAYRVSGGIYLVDMAEAAAKDRANLVSSHLAPCLATSPR